MSRNFWIIGSLMLFALIAASGVRSWSQADDHAAPADDHAAQADGRAVHAGDHAALGDVASTQPPAAVAEPPRKFPVRIRRPAGPPTIELTQPDPLGRVGRVACSTCHSIRPPDPTNRRPADLTEFHQNMQFGHGDLSCYSCHNPKDSDTLRLADGIVVEYADVMTLCAQCHGTYARKYARGYHGGMVGYWDLTRGGRVRNNCIDCHDPHVPEFPMMQPTFKPRDRFLEPPKAHGEHHTPSDRETHHE